MGGGRKGVHEGTNGIHRTKSYSLEGGMVSIAATNGRFPTPPPPAALAKCPANPQAAGSSAVTPALQRARSGGTFATSLAGFRSHDAPRHPWDAGGVALLELTNPLKGARPNPIPGSTVHSL